MAKPLSILGLIVIGLGVFFQLDASPSLYIADLLVKIYPNILQQQFNDSVILITGASEGIGAETALQLCSKTNANLILLARSKEKLQRIQNDCEDVSSKNSSGAKAVWVQGDVTKGEKMLTKWLHSALKELDQTEVDIAIVNAGRTQRSPALDTHEEVSRSILELNVLGSISTVKAVMSTYVSNKPKQLIALSSIAGKMPVPLGSTYSASKAAVQNYFDSVRAEHPEIRVTTVCAGPVATDIAKNAFGASLIELPKVEAEKKENKMNIERGVNLMLAGSVMSPYFIYHELWLSTQPYLTYMYIFQYLPDLGKLLGSIIGPKRIETWKKGESIY